MGGVPMLAPGFSYRLTMDSGDRLELSASPAGMQWIVTADGNVIEAGADEDGAHWSATLVSPKGGQVEIKARSSNDPSQEATLTVVVNPQRYARADFIAGEQRTWRETNTRNGGSVDVNDTLMVTTMADAAGHNTELRDAGTQALKETRVLDADDNRLSRSYPNGNSCTYAPSRHLLDYPLYYGKSWTTDWTYACSAGYRETAHAVAAVEDYERITVAQGTHDALRLRTQVAFTKSNDANLDGGALGQAAYSQDIVCWWSVTLKRTVKCTTTYHYVGTEPAAYSKTFAQELLAAP